MALKIRGSQKRFKAAEIIQTQSLKGGMNEFWTMLPKRRHFLIWAWSDSMICRFLVQNRDSFASSVVRRVCPFFFQKSRHLRLVSYFMECIDHSPKVMINYHYMTVFALSDTWTICERCHNIRDWVTQNRVRENCENFEHIQPPHILTPSNLDIDVNAPNVRKVFKIFGYSRKSDVDIWGYYDS